MSILFFQNQKYLALKDHTPEALKSLVVCQFTCVGCNSCDVGETTCHFLTSIKEHTETDKNSQIFKHLS